MKKLTIKLKITLWFTAFMILVCAALFAFIAIVSNSASTRDVRNALTDLIDRNVREIAYEGGSLEINDNFVSFMDGVYCLVFYENGEKVSGNAPYEELENEPFEDKSIRQAEANGDTYLIYDQRIEIKRHEDVWVRGIVLESGGGISVSAVTKAALIALPLLIILAAGGGYLIAGRSLRPIQQISETAEEIGGSGDLSKRIEMDSGGDELHRLADTFNRMFDRLEVNFEAERHFTSDASHEMRTPVSIILAQCEYAFENATGEQELYEAIGAIQKQGYRMSHLIESLLYFTRIEQGTEEISFEETDLSALVLSVCREQKEEKGISLVEDVQTGIEMKADTQLIARMLLNLIRNARRYGRENGSISVELKENGDRIILSVADDGIGIAPEELPKIWNRFYRVDKSRSSSKGASQGLGLGLSMVKQIAELHGGSVHVESELGKGSTFAIIFIKS